MENNLLCLSKNHETALNYSIVQYSVKEETESTKKQKEN